MNVRFYKFSKRENSTLQPGSGYTTYNCILKGSSSMTQAALALDLGITEAPEYNYAYIPDWNRYYFVSNWTWADRLWNCALAEDYLATWKSAVTSTNAFVLYDTTANTELTDSRLSINTSCTTSQASGSFGMLGTTSLQGNAIIVTITGKETTSAYAVNRSEVKGLLNNFDNWFTNENPPPEIASVSDFLDLYKYEVNQAWFALKQTIATGTATDNIRSAFQLPFAAGNIPGTSSRVYLGEYDTGWNCKEITNKRIAEDHATVSIPWQANDWRRNAPFHEVFLYNPFTGLIQLSNSDLIGVSSLNITAFIDCLTGDTIFEVNANGKCINQTYSNIAASYPIGASNIMPANVAGNVLSGGLMTVASAAASNPIGVVSGLAGITNALIPSSTCVTGGGGGAALGLQGANGDVRCYTVFHDTNVDPSSVSSVMGTPAMEKKSLSGLSGYVQTAGASVSGLMLDEERTTLNNMLDSGIFIE